jgi:hypothetical protein
MNRLGLAIAITTVAFLICILLLLAKRHLYRQFPLFASYVAYVILQAGLRFAFFSNTHLYFLVYWFTAPVEVILAILAVHESFRRVFRAFYLTRWFRFCFPGAIVLALLYSLLTGYFSPPAHARGIYAAIISGMLMAQYVILTISIAFFVFAKLLQVPWRIHEYRIVAGFGLSSGVTALAAGVRSVFGTRFTFMSEMLPAVSYLLALGIWVSAAAYPLPAKAVSGGEKPTLEELEQLVSRLRGDLAFVRGLLKRR